MKQMNKKRTFKRGLLIGLVIALAIALWLWFSLAPTNYYLESPGSADPLSQYVTVNKQKDKEKGNYMLTSVGITMQPVSRLRLLISKFQPFEEKISKKDLMGDSNSDAYNQLQKYYMDSSINEAIEVAYQRAGEVYHKKYLGIYVMSLQDDSAFKGHLAIGDTVTAINGHAFQSSTAFINYIKKGKLGDKVSVSYTHDGKSYTTTQKLVKIEGTKRAGLGISLVDHTSITTDIPVKVDVEDIGGPSAGMMFTLQIYTQLMHSNLRDGRNIAGTGTIAADGTVGPIGGIDKKVVAADKAGAVIFFAPNDPVTKEILKVDPGYVNNYTIAKQAAKKIKTKMKIVPVKTFSDVLTYLQNHPK